MYQKEELVGAMLLRSIKTNGSSLVLCQRPDSILKFAVTLAFPSLQPLSGVLTLQADLLTMKRESKVMADNDR